MQTEVFPREKLPSVLNAMKYLASTHGGRFEVWGENELFSFSAKIKSSVPALMGDTYITETIIANVFDDGGDFLEIEYEFPLRLLDYSKGKDERCVVLPRS